MKSLILALLLAHPAQALGWTSKQKTLMVSFGGCTSGAITGALMASARGSDSDLTKEAILLNTSLGCLLGLGASWAFVDDDQAVMARKNMLLKSRLDVYESKLAEAGVALGSPKMSWVKDPVEKKIPEEELSRYVEEGCRVASFKLSPNSSSSEENLIPVSGSVLMQSFRYYILKPENGSSGPCVRAHSSFGYLDDEMKGLSDILIDKAKFQLKGKGDD